MLSARQEAVTQKRLGFLELRLKQRSLTCKPKLSLFRVFIFGILLPTFTYYYA